MTLRSVEKRGFAGWRGAKRNRVGLLLLRCIVLFFFVLPTQEDVQKGKASNQGVCVAFLPPGAPPISVRTLDEICFKGRRVPSSMQRLAVVSTNTHRHTPHSLFLPLRSTTLLPARTTTCPLPPPPVAHPAVSEARKCLLVCPPCCLSLPLCRNAFGNLPLLRHIRRKATIPCVDTSQGTAEVRKRLHPGVSGGDTKDKVAFFSRQ